MTIDPAFSADSSDLLLQRQLRTELFLRCVHVGFCVIGLIADRHDTL